MLSNFCQENGVDVMGTLVFSDEEDYMVEQVETIDPEDIN